MEKVFTNYEEGSKVSGNNGKSLIWTNEDNRGKTSIAFKEGDIWVIPTNDGYYKIKLRLNGEEVKEVRLFELEEELVWLEIEVEVDRMLTDLGY